MEWEPIVRENTPGMLRSARRILGCVADAEDAVQDAFLKAYDFYARRSVENWGGLLHRLTVNVCLDRLRARRKVNSLEGTEVTKLAASDPVQTALAHELAEHLRIEIAKLPAHQAAVFSLSHFNGKSNREIADALNLRAGAVATALYKARQRLAAGLAPFAETDNAQS